MGQVRRRGAGKHGRGGGTGTAGRGGLQNGGHTCMQDTACMPHARLQRPCCCTHPPHCPSHPCATTAPDCCPMCSTIVEWPVASLNDHTGSGAGRRGLAADGRAMCAARRRKAHAASNQRTRTAHRCHTPPHVPHARRLPSSSSLQGPPPSATYTCLQCPHQKKTGWQRPGRAARTRPTSPR